MNPTPAFSVRRLFETFINTKKHIPADRRTHVIYLVLGLCVTLLPFFIAAVPGDEQALRCGSVPLPGACLSRTLFHAPCPGCGMTHAFMYLTHAQPRESVRWNRAGIALYVYFVLQIIFRIAILRRPQRVNSPMWINLQHYAALSMIAILVLNWFVGIWAGGNGS